MTFKTQDLIKTYSKLNKLLVVCAYIFEVNSSRIGEDWAKKGKELKMSIYLNF